MEPAPFHSDLADGPDSGLAVWTRASDGVALRVGAWPAGSAGTVLIFNGRTEYIEKYGRVARDFAAVGLATATCDWRGQGMSDRVATDRHIGHVADFADYQKDAAAFVEAVRNMGLPEPYYLIGHSMGGAIGLRALIQGLPVKKAVFSGPMWGIGALKTLGPLATLLLEGAAALGMGVAYAPATNAKSYVLKQAFKGNGLTHDPATWAWLQSHVRTDDRLGLGGPSMNWLREAKREMAALGQTHQVPCPILAMVGTEDTIVVPENVLSFSATWDKGRAEMIDGARHEPMMEAPAIREVFMSKTIAHFQA
ncbi:MAG: alpha/beta hydrolase [Pseudomonadota bacterium]